MTDAAPLSEGTRRLFVAVTPPGDCLPALAEIQRAIQRQYDREYPQASAGKISPLRWTSAEQLHLTVLFIAAFPADKVDTLCQAVATAAAQCVSFDLALEAPEPRPPGRPRMIWMPAGAAASPRLVHLHRQLQAGLHHIPGASPAQQSGRAFTSHLTLGRIRKTAGRREGRALRKSIADCSPFTLPHWRVKALELVESKPAGGIREYTVLHVFPLGSGGPPLRAGP